MYEQATIPVVNQAAFAKIRQTLESTFAPAAAAKFLRQVEKRGQRVRDFELALQQGLLGKETQAEYASLPDSDRAQVREMYLQLVEQVAPELRARFMKVYTYY
jgi:aspartyl/asparaginyl beta-hydroxylase (cupin superfamily)